MSDLKQQIAEDAVRSKSVTHGGMTVTRRSISEQIEADKYLADKAAAANMASTVKNMFSRIIPPGGH